jgi:DNA-binding CsgD family transcriptional regulator/tetratricopeptide (TPR) repeat protein
VYPYSPPAVPIFAAGCGFEHVEGGSILGSVELLERDRALSVLAEAHDVAARGEGRVVFVSGEPGIGKTSLVTRFVQGLEPGARVFVGACDDLYVPRPLGPFRDLAGAVSDELADALAADAAPHEIQSLLIGELRMPPQPTVLVLEDLHWADDATIDAVAVLGRRIGSLPALLVLTFRRGDVPPGHPLHAAVAAVAVDESVLVELAPLSERAVASLVGDRAEEVYAATGGNPFYVTELVGASASVRLPPSVAVAVLARAARLDADSRRLVELVSVVPGRVATAVLDAVMPEWPVAAEEPERRGLLEVEPRYVRFRHELARHAIVSSIPVASRRRLHAEILGVLLAANADPADVVHHADAAGAEDVVAEYAVVAARRAASLESNREAYSHYRRAADFLDRLPRPEQARVLEELAVVAYFVGRLPEGLAAIERAIEIDDGLGDRQAAGRCRRVLSRLHWIASDGRAARAAALEAVAILEPLGPSSELARGYSTVSQLEMLADDTEAALVWGERALELATELGDEPTRAHALVNIGTARLNTDGSTAPLLEAHRVAEAAGDRHEAARALDNLATSLLVWARPPEALRYADQATAYGAGHEVLIIASNAAVVTAWLRLRAGEWAESERITRREIESGVVIRQITKIVLAELAVRRGDPDAAERLAEVAADGDRTGEPQRILPALERAAEHALLTGAPMPTGRIEALVAGIPPSGRLSARNAMRVAAWAGVAGIDVELTTTASPPYAAMARRDWRAAADAFAEIGWTYDRALMLSLLEDEDALVEAIAISRGLGADPLTRRVAGRLRDLGVSVPRGPRESSRANPAGLTARQLEVLSLLADGLTNAEIADRLVVSPRTAEHHVAAVLTKLGAATRRDAARHAAELGLVSKA